MVDLAQDLLPVLLKVHASQLLPVGAQVSLRRRPQAFLDNPRSINEAVLVELRFCCFREGYFSRVAMTLHCTMTASPY